MPATYILATEDPELLRAWWVFIPPGRQVQTLDDAFQAAVAAEGIPIVLVLDVLVAERVPAGLRSVPTLAVGEPGSSAVERVRADGSAKLILSYEESRLRLGALLPLLEEIAVAKVALELSNLKLRRNSGVDLPSTLPPVETAADCHWGGIFDCVDSRERLLDEFRRLLQARLGVSRVHFFLPQSGGYQLVGGESRCSFDDPLCVAWSRWPAVLDGTRWPEPLDPAAEVTIRQHLRHWGARLLVPLHEDGALSGFLALGVRENGLPFSPTDRAHAVELASLLRRALALAARLQTLSDENVRWRLAEQYLPNVLVLGVDEITPKHVPAAVRALIAEVRTRREVRRLSPRTDQPYRASAGLVAGQGGVWVHWENAGGDLSNVQQEQRTTRLALLRDIALTLNHELGNSLVSLAALHHSPVRESTSPVLLEAVKRDIAKLDAMNRHLSSLPDFGDAAPEESDVRLLLREVSQKTGATLDPSGPSVLLSVVPPLVQFALESLIASIAENRPEFGTRDLNLRLRASGTAEQLAAQIFIRGQKLALEGVWPAPAAGDAPSHGRISVFIAKEIIGLHNGEIRAHQTTLGTEILVVLRNW